MSSDIKTPSKSHETPEMELMMKLEKFGAILRDTHVIYTSGKHGSAYVNKDAVYPHTQLTAQICRTFAEQFKDKRVEVVVAPAIGAVLLAQWTAHFLTELTGKEVLAVYAEKSDNEFGFDLKRGYDKIVRGHRCLVVEDIVNTGGSLLQVIRLTLNKGGEVLGACALCNRGGVKKRDLDDIPEFFSLLEVKLDAWEAADCPLCKKGVPINKQVGKGKELKSKK